MRMNDGPRTKIKSSGLCVTTGTGKFSNRNAYFFIVLMFLSLLQIYYCMTIIISNLGSTSWNLSINRLTQQSVSEVLRLLQMKRPELLPALTHESVLVQDLADEFNSSLVFSAGQLDHFKYSSEFTAAGSH